MTKPTNVTTFLVAGLDCPTEEQMIRRQLQAVPEIEKMDFNFNQFKVSIPPGGISPLPCRIHSSERA